MSFVLTTAREAAFDHPTAKGPSTFQKAPQVFLFPPFSFGGGGGSRQEQGAMCICQHTENRLLNVGKRAGTNLAPVAKDAYSVQEINFNLTKKCYNVFETH